MENNNLPEVQKPDTVNERKDVIDFGAMLRNYLRHWWWFAIALVLCMGAATFYIKKKSPVYLIQGMIMLNQQEDGGMGQTGPMSALISSMGFGSTTGANPENEQLKILSNSMMKNVVKELNLNYSYWQDRGFFKRRINYYKNEPISVYIPDEVLDSLAVSTLFELQGEDVKGPWTLKVKQLGETVLETEVKQLPYDAKTPYGTFHISATEHFPKSGELNVSAICMSDIEAIKWLKENVGVTYISNKADALAIDMGDVVIERGVDIVNTIMELYNNGREQDRVDYNKSVLEFIDSRLLALYTELENSESKIEQYKKNNNMVSAEAEAQYIFTRKGAMDQSAVELQTGIKVMEMLQQMLTSADTQYSLIPFTGGNSLGMGDSYFKLIDSYNALVMQRMTLAASAKEGNTALAKLDGQIEAVRANILSSIGRELQSARINYKELEQEQSKSSQRMGEFPAIEHELITLYRDREVQNAIYGFLLQKREETYISMSQSQPVGKIIDPAYFDPDPVSPKPMLIYGAALLAALGVPAVLLQLRRRKQA